MAIHFRCTTILEFDQQRGCYVYCRNEFEVDDNRAGGRIHCDRCGQDSIIPHVSDEDLVAAKPAARPTVQRGIDRDAGMLRESESEKVSQLQFASFQGTQWCTKCGGSLDADYRCQNCGYRSAIRVSERPLNQIAVQLAGFQLFLSRRFSVGESPKTLVAAMHGIVGLVSIAVVAVGLSSGGMGMMVTLAGLALLLAGYAYIVYSTQRIARKPAARLNAWQQLGWRALLFILRASRWKLFLPVANPKILDWRRKSGMGETQLLSVRNLVEYQVLDLEGLDITDTSLKRMHGLLQIKRLVLINTRVTPEGVFRLQQALPEAWIWN